MALAWSKASAARGMESVSDGTLKGDLRMGGVRAVSAWIRARAAADVDRVASFGKTCLLVTEALGLHLRECALAWGQVVLRLDRHSSSFLAGFLSSFRKHKPSAAHAWKTTKASARNAYGRCKESMRAAAARILSDAGTRPTRWRDKTLSGTELEQAFSLCRSSLVMIFVLSFFVNILALTVPLYLLNVYDHVLASRSIDTLVMLTMIVIVALAVHALIEALRRAMLARIGGWFDDRLRAPVLVAAVQSALRGDAAAAAQAWRDLGGLRSFFSGSACTALFDLPWTPIFLLAMVLVHPLLGAIGFAASVVLFGLAILNEMVTRKPLARSSAAWVESQHRFESLLRNVEAISAMGMLPGVARLLQRDQTDATAAQIVAAGRGSTVQAVARFIRLFAQVIVMSCAAWLVIMHDVSPAAIFATTILLGRSLGPVEGAIGTWKAVTGVRLGYSRMRKIMAAAPPSSKAMPLPRPSGQLSVEQVTFTPAGTDVPAVRRLSFAVNPGEILGIVGASGAGKSTLGRLIAGTIAPTSGHVRLDRADIGIWLASGGHRYMGYLPQDIELFGGTVRDNIARLQETSPEEVIAAAGMVGLHETIMQLPNGYETDIGERGMRLSGGQRQRLGLARAFFGYPRLIVLDEPNASLDAEGEDALRQAVREMRERGSTIVIIAQRFGILNQADKILVLDRGKMDAFGDRGDIAGKIKDGRTCLPARQQVITGKKSIKQPRQEGVTEPAPKAANGAVAKEETQWLAT